jgi:RNA polymerase sigma factor (TIGR02999 family)
MGAGGNVCVTRRRAIVAEPPNALSPPAELDFAFFDVPTVVTNLDQLAESASEAALRADRGGPQVERYTSSSRVRPIPERRRRTRDPMETQAELASPPSDAPDHVTELLLAAKSGDRAALDRLIPQVYDELRRVAHNWLGRERTDHSLGTTGLVHETYVKLVDQTRVQWRDRAHFFGIASTLMRRILVDHARKRGTARRGGDRRRVPIDATELPVEEEAVRIVEIDEALNELAKVDERLLTVVECRFFGGLTEEETAEVVGVTVRTVQRDWAKAKALLYDHLGEPR